MLRFVSIAIAFASSTQMCLSTSMRNTTGDGQFPVGSLETAMNLLNRFETDVATERAKDSEDYHQRAAECNRTIISVTKDIERLQSERRNLVSPEMYRSIEGALNNAVKNARSHYLNASAWSAKAAAEYLTTGEQLQNRRRIGWLEEHRRRIGGGLEENWRRIGGG